MWKIRKLDSNLLLKQFVKICIRSFGKYSDSIYCAVTPTIGSKFL